MKQYHPHLLVLLNELKKHKGMDRAESYCWFVENSNVGENCGYATAALKNFYQGQLPSGKSCYQEITELLRDIIKAVEDIDNGIR